MVTAKENLEKNQLVRGKKLNLGIFESPVKAKTDKYVQHQMCLHTYTI